MKTLIEVHTERDKEKGLADAALISTGQEYKDKECTTEAFLLMKATMNTCPKNWTNQAFTSYTKCIMVTISSLQKVNEMSSEDASNILSLFEWKEFSAALLENPNIFPDQFLKQEGKSKNEAT